MSLEISHFHTLTLYRLLNSNGTMLWRLWSLYNNILLSNSAVAENYINIINKESIFEYYEIIILVRVMKQRTLRALFGLDHAPTEVITS